MESLYSYPEEQLAAIRNKKLWCQDPKYFKRVKINPSAAIKMLMHGQQGVDKGINKSGTPIEVMGLLLGRPDHEDPNAFVISDALPLPIEGFETRVVADDVDVMNYMIELGESVETTRKEKFCGWYHTHPFDLDGTSHCFLSNTDITTQLHWQRSEDPHGNPWLAIVIDPLYSLSTGKPQMQAFRVYPPDYSPPANETPDGRIVRNDTQRVAQWGVCWNRYYVLQVEFYMSRLAQDMLSRLKNRFLWAQALLADGPGAGSTSGTTHADEARTMAALTGRLQRLSGAGSGHRRRGFGGVTGTVGGTVGGNLGNVLGLGLGAVASGSSAEEGEEEGSSGSNVNMQRVAEGVAALGGEHVCRVCALLVKQTVFCLPSHREEQEKRENSSSANASSGNSGMEVV